MVEVSLADKLDKIRSPNLQSQKHTAIVLRAVEATLGEEREDVSPTAYFAALLALLNQSSSGGNVNKDVASSVVYLLDVVMPFAPQPLLRAKFTQILSLLAPVLSQADSDAPLLRPCIGCLESLLIAQDSSSWELSAAQIGPRRAVAGLLALTLDHRPKVRKRAQEALRKVLENPPPSPSLDHPAAAMCAETAMKSLGELANRPKKERHSTSSSHDPDLMHALQLVKAVALASGGWPSKNIESLCERLLSIARTGNEHMTMAVFEVFEMIFEGMTDGVASSKLPRLLEIISELRPSSDDTQLLPPWIAILSRGYDVSAQVEPEETFLKLPDMFVMVSGFLESESQNVRISASECLVSFMANCVPAQVLLEPSIYDEKVLEKLAKAAEGLLSVKFQAAWMETFKVLGAMFDSLRWMASPFLLEAARTVGEIRSHESFAGKKDADLVLGKAIRAMGPKAVLEVLPLNLVRSTKGQPGRAWILPLVRDYTANTTLGHFTSEFVPLSEAMFQRILDHGAAEKTMEIKIYETIVQQIWSTLPGYCDLPLDLLSSFDQQFAELLANLLYQQVDLRHDICRALRLLVESNQAIASIEGDDDLILQSRVTKADAAKNLEYLGQLSGNFLAVLFNVYSQTLPQSRAPVLQTINAFLSITTAAELVETFDRVCKMLVLALQEARSDQDGAQSDKSGEGLPSTSQTLMDLVITMSIYLPRESFSALFEIASMAILRDDQPQLQKKAYKLIPRLAESPVGRTAFEERNGELQALILSSADKVSAPARRERLAAIVALVPFIPSTSLHFIPAILSEVVISCKEHNERARETAFELLVVMGKKMLSCTGALIDNSKVPHMPRDSPAASASIEEYFTMVSAGLAGSTPHMISASITGLSRILYEFRESLGTQTLSDLVQTMDLFLASNNREIVKSVLGFVKVCVISLPPEMMQPRLASLIPNLLVWGHEHKGHFRAKVKHILERMIRRFGLDVVNKYCPDADRKLIVNIKKSKERSKRRKEATREADEEGEKALKGTGHFESEYDRALYSSDSSDGSDDSDIEVLGKTRKGTRGSGKAYIVEDENEPLDLLDSRAMASISSTRPVKLRRAPKSNPKLDMDGKLILGEDGRGEGAMEIDTPKDTEESGVGAYVAALRGSDVPRRGMRGKLKWSNRRTKGDDGDDMDVDEDDVATTQVKIGSANRGNARSRGRGRRQGTNRMGKGELARGRRGLGEDKRRGPSIRGGIGKPRASRRG